MTKEQTMKNQVKGKKPVKRPVEPMHQGPVAQLEEPDLLALQRAVANPDLAAPADILALQRRYGNVAVQRLLAQHQATQRHPPPPSLSIRETSLPLRRSSHRMVAAQSIKGNYNSSERLGSRPVSVQSAETSKRDSGHVTPVVRGESLPAVSPSPESGIKQKGQTNIVQRVEYKDIVGRFQKGDLLYGLTGPRMDTYHALQEKFLSEEGAIPPIIIDEINNILYDMEGVPGRFSEKEAWDSFKGQLGRSAFGMGMRIKKWSEKLGRGYAHMREPLKEHEEMMSASMLIDDVQDFKEWLESEQLNEFSPFNQALLMGKATELFEKIKTLCQAGIRWATGRGHRIYFILDMIDQEKVVSGGRYHRPLERNPWEHYREELGVYIGDYTGAELRWLYINWPQVDEKVSFWEAGDRVDPPWEGDKKYLWRKYAGYVEHGLMEEGL